MKFSLQFCNIPVEFREFKIKNVLREIKKIVWLRLEVVSDFEEFFDEILHALDLMLTEAAELVDGLEHDDELLDTLAIKIKHFKYLRFIPMLRSVKHSMTKKIKLSIFLHTIFQIKLLHLLHQLFLGQAILLLVSVVQLETRSELHKHFLRFLIPKLAILGHMLFAVSNHLIRDFAEKSCHVLARAVARNGGHHLHQPWNRLQNGVGVAVVQQADELLESLDVGSRGGEGGNKPRYWLQTV